MIQDQKMIIKDGKFYKAGVLVPIEHGNKEQIELLAQIQDKIANGIDPHIDIEIIKKIHMQFYCLCGYSRIIKFDIDEDDEVDILEGEDVQCINCNKDYIVNYDEDRGLILKIKP